MEYLIGLAVGLSLSPAIVFFAFGKVNLIRELKSHHKIAVSLLLFMAAMGCYGIFLHGLSYKFACFIVPVTYLAAVSITDVRKREIVDNATIFFSIVSLIILAFSQNLFMIANGLLGAVLGAMSLGAGHLLRKEAIGLGDVKMFACCGILFGFPGVFYLLIRALIFVAIFSVVMLIAKKANLKTEVPFAPFVLLGAII